MKNKDVSSHMKMYSVFPSTLAVKWLRNLKSLKIAFCDLVKVVFFFEENHATSKAFNSLEVLELHGLRNLVHIWFRIPPKVTGFKNLQLLVLSECRSFYVFSYRVAKLLVQLQKIYVSRCAKMEEIIVKDDENERKDRIVLPVLKLLELQYIPNLRILFGATNEIELPLLESLKMKQCNKMKSFSYGLMRMPMLEGIEVNGSFHLLRKDHNVIIKGVTIPHTFTIADLKIATKDFSSENFLGNRGRGKVYKGWIDKKTFQPSKTSIGMPVAIKRIYVKNKQMLSEWKSEVDILGSKLHPNLVKLLGHCSEDGELLLVYEFIPRGTLDDHLFTRNLGIKPLSWDMRIKIAIGVARGLNFLHTSEKKVIHRDIRPGKILLDEDYNSKIGDFGTALWVPSDGDSHVTTMNFNAERSDFGSVVTSDVVGTVGYIDPAYHQSLKVSVKSDVYSFGVVLLELMTGLRPSNPNRPEQQKPFVIWLKSILSQERELKDVMEGQYASKAMLLIGQLALKCTEDDPRTRPTIGEVWKKLQLIDAIKEKHKH